MAEDSATVETICRAAVGAVRLVLGADKTGLIGQIKEGLTALIAVHTVNPGPAQPLLAAASRQLFNPLSEAGKQLFSSDPSPSPEQIEEATRFVSELRPVLASLPPAQVAHVTDWIMTVAEGVAKAVREKDEADKISVSEREALIKLRRLLTVT